jgi:hypothetical protein
MDLDLFRLFLMYGLGPFSSFSFFNLEKRTPGLSVIDSSLLFTYAFSFYNGKTKTAWLIGNIHFQGFVSILDFFVISIFIMFL